MNVKELRTLLDYFDDDMPIGFSNGYTYSLDLRITEERVSNYRDNTMVAMLMTDEEYARTKGE